MKLNEKILTLRKKEGLSQEELADRLNVSRQAVSRWEVGTAQPDASNILQLSKLFNITADCLLNDDYDTDKDVPAIKSTKENAKQHIKAIIGACIAALGFVGNSIIYIISRFVKVYAPLKIYDYETKTHTYLYDGELRVNFKYFVEEYQLTVLIVILCVISLIGIAIAIYNIPAVNKKIHDIISKLKAYK